MIYFQYEQHYLFYASCYAGCPFGSVEVKLENDAKVYQGYKAGLYEISSNVNGKPSFSNGNNAIQYNNQLNAWLVGSNDDIGSSTAGIYAFDDLGGLTDEKNVWFYWNGSVWKQAGTNDIIVTSCTSGTHKFLLNSFTVKRC